MNETFTCSCDCPPFEFAPVRGSSCQLSPSGGPVHRAHTWRAPPWGDHHHPGIGACRCRQVRRDFSQTFLTTGLIGLISCVVVYWNFLNGPCDHYIYSKCQGSREFTVVPLSITKPPCRFQVDLSCGCSTKPPSDVALRLSPRFNDSPCVVCSSLLRGSWAGEETLHQLPYKHGAPFETIILVQNDAFKVRGHPNKRVQRIFILGAKVLALSCRWQ